MLTVILTGGGSRRMGKDKAMLPLDGSVMALRLAEKYAPLGPVAFSVNEKGRFPVGDCMELCDHYPNCGPLNGIVSAFSETEEDVIFLTATDMPGGRPEAVERLLEHLGEHDVCLYGDDPLFAVYRRSCLAPAEAALESGQRSMRRFLEGLDVLRLETEEELLLNINTPEDYETYRRRKNSQAWS